MESTESEIDSSKESKWIVLKDEEVIAYEEDIEYEDDLVRNIPEEAKCPYDFFSLFIDENFISNLVKRTNEYAKKKKEKSTENKTNDEKVQRKTMAERWKDIKFDEMEKYIASVI